MIEQNPADDLLKISKEHLQAIPLVNQALLMTILHYQVEQLRKSRGFIYRMRHPWKETEEEVFAMLDKKFEFLIETSPKTI